MAADRMSKPHMYSLLALWVLSLLISTRSSGVLAAAKNNNNDNDDDPTRHHRAVVDWIRKHGGYFNPKQEFRRQDVSDSNSIIGIFATQDLEEGEVLASIPWECIITAGTDSFYTAMFCDSIALLIKEINKGQDSFFAPYIDYLLAQPTNFLPSAWSEEGKNLMDVILGHDMLSPSRMLSWIDLNWKEYCQGSDDAMEQNAALQLLSRADDDLLVPVYDMYNHRNGPWCNTEHMVDRNKVQSLVTSRPVKKGEELFNSYNQCTECYNRVDNYGTPELLRDYGFVEPMPQRWIFQDQDFGFDIDGEEGGELRVYWMKQQKPTRKQVRFLRQQLDRLKQVVEPEIIRVESDKSSAMPQFEMDTIRQYHDALTTAMEHALQDVGGGDDDDDKSCATGECVFQSDFYDLSSPYEADESYQACDNQNKLEYPGYDSFEETKSHYQKVTFYHHPDTNDICLDLDDILQICTCYRPQYHEFVTHFPARYKEKIQRAVFVGGGDSMVLHELLKYPDIELVVGLELDQSVVRGSFKYFHTQPHFDDDRVQWWFGDATKSLLMLPKDYFGSFDLVVVDLSETVMSYSVTEHLDILEALALLLKPDGLFVKNELYFESLSEIFDYTIQAYVMDNPIICDQAVSIGSNRIDFLHSNIDTLMKHDVEMLLLERVKDPNERFAYVHDYSKNDALAQGKCEEAPLTDETTKTAGILMILEAENTTSSLEWSLLGDKLYTALEKEGLTPLTKISHPTENEGNVGMVLMNEGVVVARTWPVEKYCAFDIQLWGGFGKMESLRTALAQVVGSSSYSLSSYRIVTGGMLGTKSSKDDKQTIGPTSTRISQNRDCEKTPVNVQADVLINKDTNVVILEETLKLVDASNMLVAVLCGSQKDKCATVELLAKHEKVGEVVPIYTCSGIESAPYLENGLTRLFECEMDTLNALRDVVDAKERLGAFIVDESASQYMAEVVDRIWNNRRNQQRLLMPHFLFLAPMREETETWRRNLLINFRWNMVCKILDRAEVILKSADSSMEVGLVTTGDLHFFVHVLDMAASIERRTGLKVEIPHIQGGPLGYQPDYKEDKFETEEYDAEPGIQQFAQQNPLGDQVVVQLELKQVPDDFIKILEKALGRALKTANFSVPNFHVYEELGDGVVFLVVSPEGTAVVVWDGDVRLDLNLFTYDSDQIELFENRFTQSLGKARPNVLLRDEQPRGTGRVVNFKRDLPSDDNEPPSRSREGSFYEPDYSKVKS